MIHIVRIITRLNIGGPAIHAVMLSSRLDRAQFSTCLVAGEPDAHEGNLSHLLEGSHAKLVRVATLRRSLRPWADLVTFVRLLRLYAREHPDIIHTHMAKAGALGRFAGILYNAVGPGRRLGRRALLVHTFHGHILDGYFTRPVAWVFQSIERWLAKRTDCLIAVSPAIRDELLRHGIGRTGQWRVVPLGIDVAKLAQLPFPNGSTPLRVGLVGRLVAIKHPRLFLEALRRLACERRRAVSGVIVGDGELRAGLERHARELGLGQIVQFAGWQYDVQQVYAGLDVLCLTSWNEGTPVAVIEAMGAGRAVIATDVGGVRDVLDGQAATHPISPGSFQVAARGVLVRPGDADGVAAALEMLMDCVELRHRLGQAARAYVLSQFSVERLLQDIEGLYVSIQSGGTG